MLQYIKVDTEYGEMKINLSHVCYVNYDSETNQTRILWGDETVSKFSGREIYDKIPV